MVCGRCGAPNPAGARFCNACGRPLLSRGDERRVVTVLFADIVGFTRLSESRDPEQVKNLVDRCFARLARVVTDFGGEVDKVVGDALVALFGAPTAHEDDAERAVRAGLRMQSEMVAFAASAGTPLRLRVGVNTGEVLVGSLRAGDDYTAMGDVVNTAQRLQTAAEPGTVVVGAATRQATRDAIAYEDLGAVRARGREEPVAAWRAIEPVAPPGQRRRRQETPFVGRDAELGQLTNAVDAAVAARRAQLLLILGEAGVGKSRLATVLAERARHRHDALVLEGRCVPYGEANVWFPVAEAIRQACGIGPDATPREAERAALATVAAAMDRPVDAEDVAQVVRGLLFLMGDEVSERDVQAVRARDDAVRAVLHFVDAVAARRPLVLVVSDLHWADELVLELVGSLLTRAARLPFVLVATARTEFADRWVVPSGRHNVSVVHLDPLEREAAGALLDALADGELDPGLRDELLDRSGGNPFFLEELVALLADADPGFSGARSGAGGDGGVMLPENLRGLVDARIDALSDRERATLEDAAVWGRSGPVLALETMADLVHAERDAPAVLAALVDKEILVLTGDRWRFHSDLLREVAYGRLTKADRARRHHAIAHHLEVRSPAADRAADRTVAVVAHHYGAAAELVAELGAVDGVPVDEVARRAVAWLEEAARRARTGQALPVTVRLFTQLLRLDAAARDAGPPGGAPADGPADPVPPAGRYRLGRARAEVELRLFDEARADIEAAAELAAELDRPLLAAQAVLCEAELHQRAGDLPTARRCAIDARRRFAAAGDGPGEAEATRLVGMVHILRGEYDEAREAVEGALAMSRRLDDGTGEAWALQHLAWIAYMAGHPDEAETHLDGSAALFAELGDAAGLSWVRGLLAFVRFHQGRFDEAEDLGEQVLAEARDRGDRWGEGMMLLIGSMVRLWSARTQDAVTIASDALELFRGIGDRVGEGQARAALGRALVASGEVQEGLRLLQEGVDRRADPAGDEPALMAAIALASAATALGEPRRALDALAALDARADVLPSGIGLSDRIVTQALAELQLGRVEAAVELLSPLEDAGNPARPDDDQPASAYALSVLALAYAMAGRTASALDVAARASASPRATHLDRCYAGAAELLARRRSGDDGAAVRDRLLAAVDAGDDLLAQALARVADEATVGVAGDATGARPVADDRAVDHLAELGFAMPGWRAVFGGLPVEPSVTARVGVPPGGTA